MKTYHPAAVPRAFGLNNTGAICHLNSLLQGLVSCSEFNQVVFANKKYLGKTATGRAVFDFVWKAAPAMRPHDSVPFVWETPLENCSEAVLRGIVSDLRARSPRVLFGPMQESASEGLILLLDMLDDPEPVEAYENTGSTKIFYEENPVSRLFYHRYQACVYCRNCEEWVSNKTDLAVQFNLFQYDELVNKPQTPAEFSQMVCSHVSNLEDYLCEKCGKRSSSRHYLLRMIPEILVMVFNLYDDNRARVPRYMPASISFPGVEGEQLSYRQVAQVEQFGSRAGGHYIARGLRADGETYRFNDCAFSRSAFAPTPNVYMVFYHCEAAAPPHSAAAAAAAAWV